MGTSGIRCWKNQPCCRSWALREQCALQALNLKNPPVLQLADAEKTSGEQGRKHFSSCNVSPVLSTDKASTPVSKGNIVKGPRSIFKEQAKRFNLELRSNKSQLAQAYIQNHHNPLS